VWPDPDAVTAARAHFGHDIPAVLWFQQRLRAHGFDVQPSGQLDEVTRVSLSAFQMKYRPARYDGSPDLETAALLEVCTRRGGWVLRAADGRWRPYAVPE
jgi:N-acetylmuramoyl-L-alanine amidase